MNKILENKFNSALKDDPNWWRGGVIYQVYPRSYQDTNNNGTGDLKGITQRLDHIASLGVDAVWISPFFTSPMKDYGYDVSDYCNVDPLFGTLTDFDALIARAHSLGLRIMIDLVLSHTSDQHAWFEQSRQSRDNPYADWYVWADPKEDGTPPNNWLSIFGGSAWQWDTRRQQYYLHNFLASQPDLNLHNVDVQNALLAVERFWLERGVDGFRLDTINFYFADKLLRDNPPLPANERDFSIAPSVNPYSHQLHIHSKNQPENLDFLRRFRAVSDEYPNIATVGEVGDAQRGLEIAGEYTTGDDLVQMCYAFEFLSGSELKAERIVETFDRFDKAANDGWACWAFSNHDVVRHATRWSLDDVSARCYATLLMAWRGSSCIYQGEELGLPEAKLNYEDLRDPYGIEFWPEMPSRDGCRTPMAWQSEEHGGFSKAKPWLPVPAEHLALSVEDQNAKNDALIHHYRRVIAMRTGSEILRSGDQVNMRHQDDVLLFERQLEGARVFCAFNLGTEPAKITLPPGSWTMLDVEIGAQDPAGKENLSLPAWGYVLLSHAG